MALCEKKLNVLSWKIFTSGRAELGMDELGELSLLEQHDLPRIVLPGRWQTIGWSPLRPLAILLHLIEGHHLPGEEVAWPTILLRAWTKSNIESINLHARKASRSGLELRGPDPTYWPGQCSDSDTSGSPQAGFTTSQPWPQLLIQTIQEINVEAAFGWSFIHLYLPTIGCPPVRGARLSWFLQILSWWIQLICPTNSGRCDCGQFVLSQVQAFWGAGGRLSRVLISNNVESRSKNRQEMEP